MIDAKRLEAGAGGLWLVEPGRFRAAVVRAVRAPCPSAREVARHRRKRLEWFRAAPSRAAAAVGPTLRAEEQLAAQGGKAVRAVKGKVAVIPVYGPVAQRETGELMKAGGTSMEAVAASLDACLADRSVDAVVFDVDSPGGSSYYCQELADKIYNARGEKKLYSVANAMACSAGYWLASSAEQMMITPSGDAGSIGVYAMHIDQSLANEDEGLRVEFISAGRFKTEGNPHQPLTGEARAYLQEQVDATYAAFLGGVKRNRGTTLEDVRRNYGEGRVFNAERAVEVGMCDRQMTLEELLARLTGSAGGSDGRRAAEAGPDVRQLRRRHEREKAKGV